MFQDTPHIVELIPTVIYRALQFPGCPHSIRDISLWNETRTYRQHHGSSEISLTSFSALLHWATPVQSTKYERVDGNSTGLFGTQRGAKHFGARFLDSTFNHSPLRFMSVSSRWWGSRCQFGSSRTAMICSSCNVF